MLTKTFYYDFMPSKAEEEALKAANRKHTVTKTLIEIRELEPKPISPNNPWVIKKALTPEEAGTGKIVISFNDTFDHIFKYWTLEKADQVVKAMKQNVVVWDTTDENNPTSYISDDMFLAAGPDHEYFLLGCMDLIRDRRLMAGDEIGMFWEIKTGSFQFRVFRSNN